MAETFTVEAVLEWKTNVPEVLRQLTQGFESLDRLIGSTKGNLGAFAAEVKELASGNRGISALAKSLERLKVPDAAITSMRELTEATRGLMEDAQASAKAFREMAEAARTVRLPRGAGGATVGPGGRHGATHGNAADAAMGAQMAGDAGMGLIERGFSAYADVQLGTLMAQSDKLVTDAVMGRANTLIGQLQKQYPALTQSEGLLLFRNTMGIFGDPNESLAALPGAARLQMLYQLAPLGRGGTGGSEVQAAEKAGDALQSFIDPKTKKLDTGLYNQWMDFQARSYQAGGGLVDAKGWLSFARTARSAGIGLSPHAMEEAQALLEMSPGRTGTALMSAFQVFGASTHHMLPKNKAAWRQAGLIGKNGDLIDRQLYQTDPFQWVWKDLVPKLAAQGVKTRDQLLAWITDHGQRSTVAGMLSDIALGQTPIANTAAKMDRQNPNLVDQLVGSDVGKLAALHAAGTNFFVALGKFGEGPGLAVLNKLTDALNGMTAWANEHPDAAKNLILFGGGLALVSKIAGDAGMAAIFVGGPLVRGLGSLAHVILPFGKGGAAASALETITGAAGLGPVGALLVALGAALFLLPVALKAVLDVLPGGTPNKGRAEPTHGGGAFPRKPTAPFGLYGPQPPPHPGIDWGGAWSWGGRGHNANTRSGAPQTEPNSPAVSARQQYQPPINLTVNLTANLDGKKVAAGVSRHIFSGSGVAHGTTGHDPTMSPMPAGVQQGGGSH